jgi:simple sugar transport system ATP-binding protein
VSADLAEVRQLADRVVVLYSGRIAGEFARGEADEERLGALMIGGAETLREATR